MKFPETKDLCLGFWKQTWDTGIIDVPADAKVLEIGCAEADWMSPAKLAEPGWDITGVDWRKTAHGGGTNIQGDILVTDFPLASFDLIVMVSSLEHIGLGSYDGDPKDADGDTKTMRRVWSWLKPGGFCYFDVPFRPDGPYSVNSNFRAYDLPNLYERLLVHDPWQEVRRYVHPDGSADAPYIALVLQK